MLVHMDYGSGAAPRRRSSDDIRTLASRVHPSFTYMFTKSDCETANSSATAAGLTPGVSIGPSRTSDLSSARPPQTHVSRRPWHRLFCRYFPVSCAWRTQVQRPGDEVSGDAPGAATDDRSANKLSTTSSSNFSRARSAERGALRGRRARARACPTMASTTHAQHNARPLSER